MSHLWACSYTRCVKSRSGGVDIEIRWLGLSQELIRSLQGPPNLKTGDIITQERHRGTIKVAGTHMRQLTDHESYIALPSLLDMTP